MSIDYAEIARLARKGRRAEERGKALEGCLTSILTSLAAAFFGGWMLMLAVQIAHRHWLPGLPGIGYWWAVLLVALLRGVFSRLPSSKTKG
jgi:hypothetical protein